MTNINMESAKAKKKKYNTLRLLSSAKTIRACLHGGGGPRVGEVKYGGSPHLSCKRDQIKIRDCMDKRVTPPKRVTSPTWGPPPPCKQALRHLFSSCMHEKHGATLSSAWQLRLALIISPAKIVSIVVTPLERRLVSLKQRIRNWPMRITCSLLHKFQHTKVEKQRFRTLFEVAIRPCKLDNFLLHILHALILRSYKCSGK